MSKKPTAMFHPVNSNLYQVIRLTHPRCLHSFALPPSLSNCLPILHTGMHLPLLSNVIKISWCQNLSVSLSRKWERKLESSASPSLALTSHLMSAIASHPILNESLLSGLTGEDQEEAGIVISDIDYRTTGRENPENPSRKTLRENLK